VIRRVGRLLVVGVQFWAWNENFGSVFQYFQGSVPELTNGSGVQGQPEP
jgi:hypothetical protein